MKPFNTLTRIILPLFFTGIFSMGARAQESLIKTTIDSRQFIFKAESAIPSGGNSRPLSSGYDLVINKSMLRASLPYFGKTFGTPTDIDNGGFQFTSMSYTYNRTDGKKGGWEINIKPDDARDISSINLTIYEDGNANLEINSIQRGSISYTGHIAALKSRNKAHS